MLHSLKAISSDSDSAALAPVLACLGHYRATILWQMVTGRRSKGSGSLREKPTGSGRWQWRWTYGKDPVTGEPRQISRIIEAKTRAAADRQVRALIAELEVDGGQGSKAPLHLLFTEWMRHVEARGRSPYTIERNKRTIAQVFGPLADRSISKITTRDLDGIYDELLARGLSPSSVRRHHAVIAAAYAQAERWGWIEPGHSPTSRVSIPEASKKPLIVPRADEIQRLVSALQVMNPTFGMAAFLAAATGARRGELCALRWLDYADGALSIRSSLYRVNGESGLKATKSGRERIVHLFDGAIEAMAIWRASCEALAAEVDLELSPECFILSSWPDGTRPLNPDSLSSAFTRTAKELDLRHVHLHSLRHFAATEMLAAGVSPKDTADVLGHANPTMTLNVYAHSTAERQRAATAAIGRALEGPIQ